MCFQKNKKIILLLIFVFIIIYLLTKHNENFDEKIIGNTDSTYKLANKKKKTTSLLNKFDIKNSIIDNTLMSNSKIEKTIFLDGGIGNSNINGATINNSDINDTNINKANINILSTTGDIRFSGEYTENNATYGREAFVLLFDKTKDVQDQLNINVNGRSTINLHNNDSYIKIGDQILTRDKLEFLNTRDKLEFLNKLYDIDKKQQVP